MATLYKTNGEEIEVAPRNKDFGFSLKEMYDLLECELIEIVSLCQGKIMVIDEEGKVKGKKLNLFATAVFQSETGVIDNIVGHALVCNEKEVK